MEEKKLNEKNKKKVLSIFKKKEVWISGIIGIIIGALLLYLLGLIGVPGLGNETIATMKIGKITEKNLYKEMKKYYPITYVLELVDKSILDEKYNLTEEQNNEITERVDAILEQYKNQYKNYGCTEETFLEEKGFESKEDFINYMELEYKTNLCCIDYFKTLISEDDIKNYYNENDIYGEIYTKHILVLTSDDVTEEQALATANEILAKLNDGISFEDVATEYTDDSTIISENVDFDWLDEDTLVEEYTTASKALEKDSYTKEPVKTNYGYHIIYCIDKKDKPSFEQAENDIVEALGSNLETDDPYIRYKALIKLREDNGLKFKDSKFEKEYQEYCEQVNSAS